ncbi:hypothetical protein [Aliidiomarina shirensis]|uniref:hypothetical protein n=1 Tax=Aliidiomarina shirensis TaxID=1048642 RepID=UPI0018E53744|nr:hypothetical protein [Aliidiomarina shirensis]
MIAALEANPKISFWYEIFREFTLFIVFIMIALFLLNVGGGSLTQQDAPPHWKSAKRINESKLCAKQGFAFNNLIYIGFW